MLQSSNVHAKPCCAGKIHQLNHDHFIRFLRQPSDVKDWAGQMTHSHLVFLENYMQFSLVTHKKSYFLCMNFLFFRAIEIELIWSWLHHRKHLTYSNMD